MADGRGQDGKKEVERQKGAPSRRTKSALLSLSLPPPPPPSPLSDSNLILGPAESLKPFTWSGRDMKIDNCDLLFLPGKQKREAGVTGRPVLL